MVYFTRDLYQCQNVIIIIARVCARILRLNSSLLCRSYTYSCINNEFNLFVFNETEVMKQPGMKDPLRPSTTKIGNMYTRECYLKCLPKY